MIKTGDLNSPFTKALKHETLYVLCLFCSPVITMEMTSN